ncbi:MAG TPA: oxygen-dependent coproporphyrinogen oxidase [Rhabdochlamydiaceae bacterium]|nr:oxygen-dependent coproporphyrinogen oxidase [Rhabdochlamydiaceae bacterium]
MIKILKMQENSIQYLKMLRETIIAQFENLETEGHFIKTPWDYKKGQGGGEMAVLRGAVFEKAAVNFSAISGSAFPMQDGAGPFFATGISLITHMANPHAPTVHMNLRYIQTEKEAWFGGGYDLTPMGFPYEEDTTHFHQTTKQALDLFDPALYPEFSDNAKNYFFIPHRQKERGVGGIFFDHYHDGEIWKQVGTTFLNTILPIYKKRILQPFDKKDKETQLRQRAHYVEFNLLYDRGTKFGFLSGGNPEAILCSLPPLAAW